MTPEAVEEVVVPKDLKTFLEDVTEARHGYELGKPWKFSEKALLVVVPITRKNAPRRAYTTMYEALKDVGMKDTGAIDQVELQNKTGKAVFVRAGTIFAGDTQERAAQHSGVYKTGKETVKVRCVHQTHGIHAGSTMSYGDIAPMGITRDLMGGDQSDVWDSVMCFTTGVAHRDPVNPRSLGGRYRLYSGSSDPIIGSSSFYSATAPSSTVQLNHNNDDLLGHLEKIRGGQKDLDEMMQKVPLFEDQAGAVIFDPVGVTAVECFDSPKSWEAVKQDVIEKYGNKVEDKQAEHLFELQEDRILPALRKFIASLDKFTEKTVRQDDLSETRSVCGENVIGEYTLVKDRTVHVLLIKDGAS